jgi:DNA integrity scanning protein DisA with diadenylate cyclase activity
MWNYQPKFQRKAKSEAKGIFDELDSNLNPNVILIGILFEDDKDSNPVYLEPQNCGYSPDSFLEVKDHVKRFVSLDKKKSLFFGDSVTKRERKLRLKRGLIKNAIQTILKREDEKREIVSFCSWPVVIQGYMVCTILQFDRKTFNSYYALKKNQVEDVVIATSFLDAIVIEFLERCSKTLTKPGRGSGQAIIDSDHDELICKAGKNLMYTPAWAGGKFEGLYGLFNTCNIISSLRYEGREGTGNMLIAKRGHPNIETTIELSSPVRMHDYRAVRRLIELSSNEFYLLSNAAYIYGLGKLTGSYDQDAENLFSINFTENFIWELVHANNVMMIVKYGHPELPKMKINKERFKVKVRQIFPGIESDSIEILRTLFLEAIDQKKGTIVVVSTGAQEEATRILNQCTKIKPVKLTPEIMQRVTTIDGAVIIDTKGICYAVGVILDGLASKKGNPSRGARYNSAIRYVESSKYSCLAIVVSEDGSIDFLF